ncbi:GH32 C-terminal domain-containing protein [Floccifex sp.]|uniref:GH32 C-terminal domain-containing protein n=1 Tax=Floccifex sp. TaxID=2815810 RepID=UPI003F1202B6
MKTKRIIHNGTVLALSCALSLSAATQLLAEENETLKDGTFVEDTQTQNEDLELDSNIVPLEEEPTSTLYNGLPGLKGNFTTTESGYVINETDGDNVNVSDVSGKVFSFSTDITFKSGLNLTSFIFGADKNQPGELGQSDGKFFGLELALVDNKDLCVKLFQNPIGPALGDNVIERTYVTSTTDPSAAVHFEVAVDNENNLSIKVNGISASYTFSKDFKGAYAGGYFGMLTYRSEVEYSNIQLNAQSIPVPNFSTNLDNLHGLNGTWKETEEGLFSSGNGDNFAISNTKVKNFEYSAKITNKSDRGAGSLVFRSAQNPRDNSYVMNVDYSNKVFKLFSFPTGGTIKAVSLNTIPENEDGSYDIKVQVFEDTIRVFINNIGIINIKDSTHSKSGYLGLLTWDGTFVYQDVQYRELDKLEAIADPKLMDLIIESEGVSITPTFDSNVKIYGMDLEPDVQEAVITPKVEEGSKVYVLKYDEYGNVIQEKTLVEDSFSIHASEFVENYMDLDLIIETKEGFTDKVSFTVNHWLSNEELANEEYRPQFHVTPQTNFMNDPNGMVYDSTDGYYHMFYQYSPKNNFYNQSWAHVRSKDLVNWEQRPLGLQIDDNGLIFSGCAMEDTNNVSGLFSKNRADESRLIAYFTYHNTKDGKQAQAMAYSKDHGETWIKYGIILDNSHTLSGNDFRDPKVFQIEGDNQHWYMVTAGGAAQIFVTEDLINWEFSQNLTYPDGGQIYSECPMMYKATVEGTNEEKWIYGGSAGFYVVGNMTKDENGIYKWKAESNRINVESNENPWGGFGKYATMTFYKDGTNLNRTIGVSWLQDFTEFEGKGFKGVQSLPQSYGLRRINGNYVITCYPVQEVEDLRDVCLFETNQKIVTSTDENILKGVSGLTYDIDAVFTLQDDTKEFGFKLRKGNGQEVVYTYDVESQKMKLDVSNTVRCQNSGIYAQSLTPMEGNKIHLRIIVDQGAIESFGNYGEANISTVAYTNNNNIGMEFFVHGSIGIDSFNIYDMKSMYSKQSGSQSDTVRLVLDAPEYVPTFEEFTVNANVYPNTDNKGVIWEVPEEIEIVQENETSIRLKGNVPGNYTVSAIAQNGMKESIQVRIDNPCFNTNASGWEVINGNWMITDQGAIGNNAARNDSFYMSKTTVDPNKSFTLTGDIQLSQGQAAGIVFGVQDRDNPTSDWFCANIDTKIGEYGAAKLFQNRYGELWNVTRSLNELNPNEKGIYHLKLLYNGAGTITYYVNDVEVGTREGISFDKGYIGIQTFKSDAIFNNVYLVQDTSVKEVYDGFTELTLDLHDTQEQIEALLPSTLKVLMENGTVEPMEATWDISNIDTSKLGKYSIRATVAGNLTHDVEVTVINPANYEDLESLLEVAQKVDPSLFTEESYAPLKVAMENGLKVLQNEYASQEEINEATIQLQNAMNGLERIPSKQVDTSELDKLIHKIENIDLSKYSTLTVNKLKTVLKEAKELLSNPNVTQEQVDAMIQKLNKALNGLRFIKNNTGIQTNAKYFGLVATLSLAGILSILKKKQK